MQTITDRLAKRVKSIKVSGIRQMPMLAAKVPGAISLGQGIPDLKTPQYIRQGVSRLLESSNEVGKYSLQPGLPELKQLIAQRLSVEAGRAVDPEKNICVTTGAMEALAIAIATIIDDGDEVLLFDPGYPSYIEQTLFAGGKPVFVPLNESSGWVLDVKKLRAAVTKKTKAIIFCNPANPTGMVFSQTDIAAIVAVAEEFNLFLIGDLTYEFLTYGDVPMPSLIKYASIQDRLILCYSFSKEFAMTGWRVGYLYAPEAVLEQASKIHDAFVICAPTISQYAALVALTQKPESGSENIKADLAAKRDVICKRLDALSDLFSYQKPQGAYYILGRYKKTKLNSWEFTLRLLNEAKVVVIPGSEFGSQGEGCVRFSYGASIENINKAFDSIEAWNKTL